MRCACWSYTLTSYIRGLALGVVGNLVEGAPALGRADPDCVHLWVCLNVIPLWGGVLFVCGCFAIDGAGGVAGSVSVVGEQDTAGITRWLHDHSGRQKALALSLELERERPLRLTGDNTAGALVMLGSQALRTAPAPRRQAIL